MQNKYENFNWDSTALKHFYEPISGFLWIRFVLTSMSEKPTAFS